MADKELLDRIAAAVEDAEAGLRRAGRQHCGQGQRTQGRSDHRAYAQHDIDVLRKEGWPAGFVFVAAKRRWPVASTE